MTNATTSDILTIPSIPTIELATLGGGCFWCTEAVFQRVRGVLGVENGYAGGHTINPTYETICTGQTGHAEVVRVRFDPLQVTYTQILQVFFSTHDATTLNRQGHDVGTQYRSLVVTHSVAQANTLSHVLEQLAQQTTRPITTQIMDAQTTAYYAAESYHQNYYIKHPTQGYCAAVIASKVTAFLQMMPALTKQLTNLP